jgi:hypothetical protein
MICGGTGGYSFRPCASSGATVRVTSRKCAPRNRQWVTAPDTRRPVPEPREVMAATAPIGRPWLPGGVRRRRPASGRMHPATGRGKRARKRRDPRLGAAAGGPYHRGAQERWGRGCRDRRTDTRAGTARYRRKASRVRRSGAHREVGQHHVLVEGEMIEQRLRSAREAVVVVADGRLARLAEAPAVIADGAVALREQRPLLTLPRAAVERIAVDQDDGRAGAVVVVVAMSALFSVPALTSGLAGAAVLYEIAFDWDVDDEITGCSTAPGLDAASWLEPGCGTGRIVEVFARRGLEAVGVDRSAAMLDIARQRSSAQRREMMRDVRLPARSLPVLGSRVLPARAGAVRGPEGRDRPGPR